MKSIKWNIGPCVARLRRGRGSPNAGRGRGRTPQFIVSRKTLTLAAVDAVTDAAGAGGIASGLLKGFYFNSRQQYCIKNECVPRPENDSIASIVRCSLDVSNICIVFNKPYEADYVGNLQSRCEIDYRKSIKTKTCP